MFAPGRPLGTGWDGVKGLQLEKEICIQPQSSTQGSNFCFYKQGDLDLNILYWIPASRSKFGNLLVRKPEMTY